MNFTVTVFLSLSHTIKGTVQKLLKRVKGVCFFLMKLDKPNILNIFIRPITKQNINKIYTSNIIIGIIDIMTAQSYLILRLVAQHNVYSKMMFRRCGLGII